MEKFSVVCNEGRSKEFKEDPATNNKHCVDICIILNKQLLGPLREKKNPTMEKFSVVCNEGRSKEFKEDPATNKKCVDSCIG
uniref:Uncharacterized protein n=2 Tax=Oryza TaxID=4527 RepID=Q6K3E2_ORYSJ|nr:hypothetical protein [Oryza sativa Japonica Group]BAD22398.1 hypothetical protein [Oryza sativa Japonica Group]